MVVATSAHLAGVVELLSDPAVSEPIYDLPRPLNRASIAGWMAESEDQRQRGEAVLLVECPGGIVTGYMKITVWPERASAELGGALRADRQSTGVASLEFPLGVAWMFATLGVRLVCLTAAFDNVRSARLIDRIGFIRKGERDAIRPDGTTRRSLYWELTRDEWQAIKVRQDVSG